MSKRKIDNIYKELRINLNEFNLLTPEEQYSKIEEILNEMYEGKFEVTKAYVLKCIKLTVVKNEDYLYLRENLTVEKSNNELIFSFKKNGKKLPILILLIATLLIGALSATYFGILYLQTRDLNKDINGDGIPDINLDLDNDRKAEINIDTDGDDKPDLNIDYKGDRDDVFNIDTDDDGIPDKNIVNDATENPGECKLNCDSDGDGWPDYNYDIDGDGEADLDKDTDNDGLVDDSIDLNGDRVCDINCDDDNDGVCDRNCIDKEIDPLDPDDENYVPSGPVDTEGDTSSDVNSAKLSVVYEDFGELVVEGLVPTDQGSGVVTPEKKFTITNLSDFEVIYKLSFLIETNTFESQNFKYKIESTNGGYSSDYQTAPWEDTLLSSYVVIDPLATQEYTLTFMLEGINAPQDYDQGQKFVGHIKVGD